MCSTSTALTTALGHLVKAIFASGLRLAAGTAWKKGPHNWRKTREWLGETGQAAKNQPWNLMPMKSPAHHAAVHGKKYRGQPPYGLSGRAYHGTPQWFKATVGYSGGRGLNEAQNDNY